MILWRGGGRCLHGHTCRLRDKERKWEDVESMYLSWILLRVCRFWYKDLHEFANALLW